MDSKTLTLIKKYPEMIEKLNELNSLLNEIAKHKMEGSLC